MGNKDKETNYTPVCPFDFMKDCSGTCPNQSASWEIITRAMERYSLEANQFSAPITIEEIKELARSGMNDLERKSFQALYRNAMERNYPGTKEKCLNKDYLEPVGYG